MMKIYMETPFYGVPRLIAELKRRGAELNYKRVHWSQKSLNLQTVYLYPHFMPKTHIRDIRNSPYFLRKCKVERPNQV